MSFWTIPRRVGETILGRPHSVVPDWESVPWDADAATAAVQKGGYGERATKALVWKRVPFSDFPAEGLFGHSREWFTERDVSFYVSVEGEDLLLIQLIWHGWPDPPEWGLASRPTNQIGMPWAQWGFFPNLPENWTFLEEDADNAQN